MFYTSLPISAMLCRRKNKNTINVNIGGMRCANKPLDADLTGFRHKKSQVNADVARSQLRKVPDI